MSISNWGEFEEKHNRLMALGTLIEAAKEREAQRSYDLFMYERRRILFDMMEFERAQGITDEQLRGV